MDQCIVNAHSRGNMKRQPQALQEFFNNVTIGFKVLARVVHEEGLKLAIATHSDENEYFTLFKSEKDYVIGYPYHYYHHYHQYHYHCYYQYYY